MLLIGRLLLVSPLLVSACGSTTTDLAPDPTISELTLEAIDPSDTTRIAGSIRVHDAAGLTTLMLNTTIDDGETTTELPPVTVDGIVEGQLDATARFRVKSKADFHTGSYQLTVSATEGEAPSNSLTATFTVE